MNSLRTAPEGRVRLKGGGGRDAGYALNNPLCVMYDEGWQLINKSLLWMWLSIFSGVLPLFICIRTTRAHVLVTVFIVTAKFICEFGTIL